MPVRVLIVDDCSCSRDGLRCILEAHSDMDVVGEAENGAEALEQALRLQPDVILMDAQMPLMDGIEATFSIKRQLPNQRILCMAVHSTHAAQALEAGASAFLMKDAPRNELLASVRDLAASVAPRTTS